MTLLLSPQEKCSVARAMKTFHDYSTARERGVAFFSDKRTRGKVFVESFVPMTRASRLTSILLILDALRSKRRIQAREAARGRLQ
jgi:hypothetical protein